MSLINLARAFKCLKGYDYLEQKMSHNHGLVLLASNAASNQVYINTKAVLVLPVFALCNICSIPTNAGAGIAQ